MSALEFDPNALDLQDEELKESFLKLGFDNLSECTAYFRSETPSSDWEDPLVNGWAYSNPRINSSF